MGSSEPHRMLLHYRLAGKIGSGGMGEVYKAEDTKLGRTVAIKLLSAAVNENLAAKRRVIAKAREIARRLLDTAGKYQVHKYIAVAHKLMAQIAIAEGDSNAAETEFAAALGELQKYPAPVVTWRTYAELGRLKSDLGDVSAARDAFARAAEIVNEIANNVADSSLRETFLNSKAVRDVMVGA